MPININGNILLSGTTDASGTINTYPNVVLSGMTLWLDAGRNFSHYSANYYDCGYGCQYYSTNPGCTNCNTYWLDLSTTYSRGTLNNGAALQYQNGGSIYFDGSNDSATIPYSSTNHDFSAGQTICMWIKPVTGASGGRKNPYNQAYGGSGTITHENGTNFNYFFGTNGGDNQPYVGITSGFSVVENELAHIVVTRSQSLNTCRWYKNGVWDNNSNSAGGYASVTNSTNNITIGNGYAGFFIGHIYIVMVYNRYFTAEEVLQNFNADRQRFGM
jgi:hypothetical protein